MIRLPNRLLFRNSQKRYHELSAKHSTKKPTSSSGKPPKNLIASIFSRHRVVFL